MSTVTLEEAQTNLAQTIDRIMPDEEVIITRNNHPVARLVDNAKPRRQPKPPGSMRGTAPYVAPDFDAPL